MNEIVKKINLDFAYSAAPQIVFAKQHDSGTRIIEITPLNNGVNMELAESVKARMAFKKSDYTQVIDDEVLIEDGIIKVTLKGQALAAAGECLATLILYEDIDSPLSSQNFYIFVEKSASDESDVKSNSEYKSLENRIEAVENEIEKINDDVSEIADIKADVAALKNDVFWLKAGSEGNTYVFDTVRDEATIRAIPKNACRYAVLESVDGKTLPDTNATPALYANKLNSITIKGKNLVSSTFYDFENWYTTGSYGRFIVPTPIPKSGNYIINAKKNPDTDWGTSIFVASVSKDGGDTWTAPPEMSDGYLLTSGIDILPLMLPFEKGDLIRFGIYPNNQSTIDNIIDVQIEYGDADTAYAPYTETVLPIPEAIKSLDGYGLSISDTVRNYIDFERKKYVRMCYLRPTEPSDYDRNDVLINNIFTLTVAPIEELPDEPNEEDISDLLPFDNIIEVQGGGFVFFDVSVEDVSGSGIDTLGDADAVIPSTITYQLKL